MMEHEKKEMEIAANAERAVNYYHHMNRKPGMWVSGKALRKGLFWAAIAGSTAGFMVYKLSTWFVDVLTHVFGR